jgi:hypothetical protein
MCGNLSLMEVVVAERLAAARAAAADERMLQALRPPRAALRARVGARLVEIGQRLLDPAPGRRRVPASRAMTPGGEATAG